MKVIDKKDFRAVDFMRNRREELSDLYNSNYEIFLKQLEQVREKYKNKFLEKNKSSHT